MNAYNSDEKSKTRSSSPPSSSWQSGMMMCSIQPVRIKKRRMMVAAGPGPIQGRFSERAVDGTLEYLIG